MIVHIPNLDIELWASVSFDSLFKEFCSLRVSIVEYEGNVTLKGAIMICSRFEGNDRGARLTTRINARTAKSIDVKELWKSLSELGKPGCAEIAI
jgi:hypothetical protein